MSGRASLADKAVLITGAAGGIGTAAVERVAADGGLAMVADVNADLGTALVERIVKDGGRAEFVQCDVTKSEQVREAVEATVSAFGRLDCAFNIAGWEGRPAPLAEYDEDAWNRIIAINLTGMFLAMRYELPVMVNQGHGAIVNVASVSGFVGQPSFGPYNATKAGVIALTKAAAVENATAGVRVNAVAPGYIETAMLTRVGITPGSELYSEAARAHPMNRLGRPEEIAAGLAWLASDDATFVTGETLLVDGGFIAGGHSSY